MKDGWMSYAENLILVLIFENFNYIIMKTGLLFSGQGSQKIGMGYSLYKNSKIAREIYRKADKILNYKLTEFCFEGPMSELTKTSFCQPALYVQGYSIYSILRKSNKIPNLYCVSGLSLGEITALTVAGVVDFCTGLRIVDKRSRLMQEACVDLNGSMASLIGGRSSDVIDLCSEYNTDIANFNCPGQTVISGPVSNINSAIKYSRKYGFRKAIRLNVSGAYHSRLMESARNKFSNFLKNIKFSPPIINFISNSRGNIINEPDKIKSSIVNQLISPVRWSNCMVNARDMGVKRFYECGSGKILSGLLFKIDPEIKAKNISSYEDFLSKI